MATTTTDWRWDAVYAAATHIRAQHASLWARLDRVESLVHRRDREAPGRLDELRESLRRLASEFHQHLSDEEAFLLPIFSPQIAGDFLAHHDEQRTVLSQLVSDVDTLDEATLFERARAIVVDLGDDMSNEDRALDRWSPSLRT
jgi:hypothetical protein